MRNELPEIVEANRWDNCSKCNGRFHNLMLVVLDHDLYYHLSCYDKMQFEDAKR